MIKSVTVVNYRGESLELPLNDPFVSGFGVGPIEGLGPGDAVINFTENAVGDGGIFNSARSGEREITLDLAFFENPDIETTRHKSYRYFPKKKPITLIFKTTHREAYIKGYVKKNEPRIFSQQSGCQVSIVCVDPLFYSLQGGGTNYTTFSSVEPLFQFPFSNNSLTENLLKFGNVKQYEEKNIVYEGDTDIGMIVRINATGPASGVVIYNTETRETMKIDTTKMIPLVGSEIIAGDEIVINTMYNQKGITLLRGGIETNILRTLARNASWFTLRSGDNIFAYTADSGAGNLSVRFENQTAYEGI